jgi:hypothetical protein
MNPVKRLTGKRVIKREEPVEEKNRKEGKKY